MRKNILSILIIFIGFTACQKKQYAFVQKENIYKIDRQKKIIEDIVSPLEEKIDRVIENNILSSNDISFSTKGIQNQDESLQFNEQKINSEFEKLNRLEQYINSHEKTVVKELKDIEIIAELDVDTLKTNVVGDLPANIPAFWWGCVLGLVGVLLVFIISDKDRGQTKDAFWGCFAGVALYIILSIIFSR